MGTQTGETRPNEEPPILEKGDSLIPGYIILNHLQRGKDCDVYDVWSEERQCHCIGKTLRPDCIEKHAARKRLIREGEDLKTFTHPNLVRVYEVYSEPIPTIIEEALTGQTLSHLIKLHKKQHLPVNQLAHMGIQLCSVMHYLHLQDRLHIDLKSSNIISQPPLAKVIDLSIAAKPGEIKEGAGTRQFMAPEQASGDVLSTATDVWGIGAVLYHASTGKRPFKAYHGSRYDQLERTATPVKTQRPLPDRFANIVDKCLQSEPSQRPKTHEIVEELKKCL